MASKIFQYLKRMATSLLIMVMITIGMATGNQLLRYGSIIILLVAQVGYGIIKNIRASPLINSNMEEAVRAKSDKALMDVRENEVSRAKIGVKEGTGLGLSTLALFLVPLGIFIGTGYVLRILVKGIQSWQSFAIGFLISMPFSLILQAKSGIAKGPIATPNSYRISRKGIVFDHVGRSYIIHFPLKNINVKKENNFIEVEGPSIATIIPNKLKLFTNNINRLHTLLNRFTEKSDVKASTGSIAQNRISDFKDRSPLKIPAVPKGNKCPSCGESVRRKFKMCPYCGQLLKRN